VVISPNNCATRRPEAYADCSGVQLKMKKPDKARLLIRCRQLTVVSCIQKSARGGSSNQSAAIVLLNPPKSRPAFLQRGHHPLSSKEEPSV